MGRRILTDETPMVSMTFLGLGLAMAVSIIIGLCSFRFRKKSPLPPQSSPQLSSQPKPDNIAPPQTPEIPSPAAEEATKRDKKDTETKELPLPSAMDQAQGRERRSRKHITKSMSEIRLTMNLSMKLPRTLSMARNRDGKDESTRYKKEKLKMEDSIWMKTIILGEKCKVSDEEEEAVIYEGKGRKISAYHPRTASSLSVSRQCSVVDQDAIPKFDHGK
ncbi:hypothetical protein UlMin_035670 [Ulmus minor]